MYAVKVEQGRERAEVRHFSSGFLPSYRRDSGSSGRGSVRSFVVPGYVFTLVRTRNAVEVPAREWEIIEKISDSRPSAVDGEGKIVSGPLMGLDQYVVQAGYGYLQLCVNLLGEARTYLLPCGSAEESGQAEAEAAPAEDRNAAMLKRAEQVGVHAAAKEFGIAWQTLAKLRRRAQGETGPGGKGTASGERTGAKTGRRKAAGTAAPKRTVKELEAENAALRKQVEELTAKLEKLEKEQIRKPEG